MPPEGDISHCFPLDLVAMRREVVGVSGVMDAYRIALTRMTLHGPTNFAPTIAEYADKARLFPRTEAARYQILLIVTDGIISDMARTKSAIIAVRGELTFLVGIK